LKLEGFSFAIDDFGAGFASYAYIKHFPIDFVKIDGEIVRTMTSNKIDEAFIKSTVTLTKALNMKTIAEFVENEETLQALISAGIDFVQGYYVGKPSENLL
jgi:EAL domain-containing protein (putative c-di-GMP-specific phosphodiesterase class I)